MKGDVILKRKKRQRQIHIETIYSPYHRSDDDSFNEYYQQYLQDSDAIVENNGITYYKALNIERFTRTDKVNAYFLVALDNRMNLQTDDILADENGILFSVRGFAFIRFSGGCPEWYKHFSMVELTGASNTIGHYFTVYQRKENK